MGIISNLLAYQVGKRAANRKRGRQERRAKFVEEWREATNPYTDNQYDDDCDCEH